MQPTIPLPNPLAPIARTANREIARRLVQVCRTSASPARWIKLEAEIARHLEAAARRPPR
jgi:hypothetical protein